MRRLVLLGLSLLATNALGCSSTPDPALMGLAGVYARGFGLDEGLVQAVVWVESSFCPTAVSPKGAVGLGQLMPGTAAALGVNPWDSAQNLWATAKYLREQWDAFGHWELTLAAYNAGPGNVTKYGSVPPFAETQSYRAMSGCNGPDFASKSCARVYHPILAETSSKGSVVRWFGKPNRPKATVASERF